MPIQTIGLRIVENISGRGLPWWLSVEHPPNSVEGVGSIPGLGRSPWRRKWLPCQYSWVGKPMDRGAWWATVSPWGHRRVRYNLVTKSTTVSRELAIWIREKLLIKVLRKRPLLFFFFCFPFCLLWDIQEVRERSCKWEHSSYQECELRC